ncbi:MAG: NAD(P)H-binding protein [Thermoanaerobaculia bacterium]
MPSRSLFVTGATGYLGRRVLPDLIARGHSVRTLVRPGSEGKLPAGAEPVIGDALDGDSFTSRVAPADTLLQLVGVPHPGPAKAALFRSVDLVSAKTSAQAAADAHVAHFVYVSVAHPAPAMKAYWQARAEAEAFIEEKKLNATILRPWYVLGPGHRWPYLLLPGYWIAERLPATRETARRLGLVTLDRMAAAIVRAVENPAVGIRVVEVPEIRASRL